MTEIKHHTITTDSFLQMWKEYDEFVAQGYTKSDFNYYVAPEKDIKPLFVISMVPPTDKENTL